MLPNVLGQCYNNENMAAEAQFKDHQNSCREKFCVSERGILSSLY